MKLYLEEHDETREIPLEKETTLKELLKKENILIESVILVKNGQVCLEDEKITDKDEVKLLSVLSGG
ncbi:MoaD/ThiS family protein [Candidatus Woesearchaeota archaeon]|nr:MoaD/ThiS family protein [Nanoarchaeota archaeon]MCB9370905.1 MoaD/ThiS family protein [Candidatus Woesearchaeota archaeon]USN44006.1 MAG: MoaD/ThiS family protein [Candidatus Woesearchaeota archaeon]